MKTRFLERLAEGPVLGDGGYYLELERRCLGSYATQVPLAVLQHPEGVLELHREFARAGAEVVQAMAWGVEPLPRDQEDELHRLAVQLARDAAGPDRFVAGNISRFESSMYDAPDYQAMTEVERHVEAQRFYERRVGQQAAAGVDLFIIETFKSVADASLVIPFVKQAGLPAVVTLTFLEREVTLDGCTPAEAARRLADQGADVVGVNCQRPPQTLLPLVRAMREAISIPICAQPTAYELEPGEVHNALGHPDRYPKVEPRYLTRYAMADYAREAQRMGVNLIGGCCGVLPYHVRAMAEALGKPVELPDVDRGYAA